MIIGGYDIPNIALYLGAFVLVFIVYVASGESLKLQMRRWLFKLFPYMFLIGILIYGLENWGTLADHENLIQKKYAWYVFGFLGMLYLIAKNWIFEFRYNTTPFVANGVFGSCALHYDIGKWTVWYLGTSGKFSIGTEGFVFPWPFANKIVVTPKVSWDYNGDVPVSITQCHRMDIGRLLPEIKSIISKDFKTVFARDNVYFGIVSEKLMTDDPKYEELNAKIERISAKYNELEGDFDDVAVNKEKYVGHIRRTKILSRGEKTERRAPASSDEL